MASLQDRLDRTTVAWKPEEGDSLTGRVIDIEQVENEYGVYPALTVLTDDGQEKTWHAFTTVARSEVAKRRPKVGDSIGVKYLGQPTGKSYKLWRVVVEHVDPEPRKDIDWDGIAAQAGVDAEIDEGLTYVDDRPAPGDAEAHHVGPSPQLDDEAF